MRKHTIGPGVWRENCKSWNIRKTKYSSWIMGKKLKNEENEKQTVYDLEYGDKQ